MCSFSLTLFSISSAQAFEIQRIHVVNGVHFVVDGLQKRSEIRSGLQVHFLEDSLVVSQEPRNPFGVSLDTGTLCEMAGQKLNEPLDGLLIVQSLDDFLDFPEWDGLKNQKENGLLFHLES